MPSNCISCESTTCFVRTESYIGNSDSTTRMKIKEAKRPKKLKIKLPKTVEDFIIVTRSNEAMHHPDKLCFRIVLKSTQQGYPIYYDPAKGYLHSLSEDGDTILLENQRIRNKTVQEFLDRLGDTIVIKKFTGPQRALIAKSLAKVRNKQQPGCKNYLVSAITELATLLIANSHDREVFIRECMASNSNIKEVKENTDDLEPV